MEENTVQPVDDSQLSPEELIRVFANQHAIALTRWLDDLPDEALIALSDAIDQTRLARLSETFHA